MAYDINDFVRGALESGASKDEVRETLAGQGWPAEEISDALSEFGDQLAHGQVVPRRKPYLSAKEAFMYILMFVMLYISAFNFGTLSFELIDMWLPDALDTYRSFSSGAVRFAVSSLVIAFPMYIWMAIKSRRAIQAEPAKRDSKIRKWLTNLTLLFTAMVLVGDSIALVNEFLSGELTLRFFLKIAVIGLIAGSIFGYYRFDLNDKED